MKIKPCPFCGGRINLVIKLVGTPSVKSMNGDYSDFEEFEQYIYCSNCDDLENEGAFIEDVIIEEMK